MKRDIYKALHDGFKYFDGLVRERISKKLNALYGGYLYVKQKNDSFVNLSSRALSNDEVEFLNLGINCHVEGKFKAEEKYAEIELLFQQISQLEKQNIVKVDHAIKPKLLAEATKRRSSRAKRDQILPPRLIEAAKLLRDDDSIVIRRADKTAIYVILNKDDYSAKLDNILSDKGKFKQISADPTENLKKKVNGLIDVANSLVDGVHFKPIIGDYKPGYLYGNVKIHKEGNPLRPIISQVPTPTYEIAKQVNKLVSPYIPTTNT